MIAYFDTSALVKLVIEEPGSDTVQGAWDAAQLRTCATLGWTEGAAAIGRAVRMDRLDRSGGHEALLSLDAKWKTVSRSVADETLSHKAAVLAIDHGLRGYDAVHLAAATDLEATMGAADGPLLAAALNSGRPAIDVSN